MKPKAIIIRRAEFCLAEKRPLDVNSLKMTLDGVTFESAVPSGQAEVVEINAAADRLVDFVNSVQLR